MSHIKLLKDFRIPFETINDCTKNFANENFIGKGGYGNVYKGILSWAQHNNKPVAVKRLNETGFQGNKEFYTEITMLSQFRHKNIIALVGFCDKGKEMIIVYEYASRGSLDKYLTNDKLLDQLSWKRRLKICISIASALEYLHNHFGAQHRVIHRDMKCANILLDDNWKPKLSDFGLSRIGLANQQNTFLITNVAGTHGYCDPQYERTGILTKESDVYSFGVVLSEVLCGRLGCVIEYHDERRFLHHLVRTYYKIGEVYKIVDYRIKDHITGTKMSEFSAIAYQCLQETREERPPIHEVVLQLKKLKDAQKDHSKRRLDTRQFDSNGNSVASQTSNVSSQNKFMKLLNRDRGWKTKSLKTPSGQQGSGSPWSLFEDQALVVLVHDMGANWEFISDAINSTSQFKCISRNSKECKERHKILMGRDSGDGADSAEDSGSSQPYPSILPGIPEGSARQLFERLQGPMEEASLKSHFEKIIMIWQQPPYRKTQDNQDPKQLQQPHGSHALALSQVCPNNLNGGPVLMPLDPCETISPSPEFIPIGYQGPHMGGLPVPNHGNVAPMVPGSSPASSLPGSASGPLSPSLRDGRYGIPRAGSLSIYEQHRMQQFNQMSARNMQQSSLPPGSHSRTDRGVRMLPGVNGMNRNMTMVAVSLGVGSLVWVEDADNAWIDGEVIAVTGEEIKVASTSGKTVVAKSSNVYPKDAEAPPCGVDDMTKLAYLHEPGVLNNLRSRYDINEIYTYTGSILIAVNPFTRLPHLYDSHMMQQYKGAAFGELSPHPFAVADAAYRVMINEGISQSILVRGESGAGKTESTKQLMRYLAYIGGRASTDGRGVEQKVLESYPVLEAFGNAKTVRNNNSSRFCKFVEIQFDEKGRISGAAIRTCLLERSRVCQLSDPERNYHCFYMLCAAPPEVQQRYKVGDPKTFHYLNQSNCYKIDGLDEQKEYIATKNAMDVVGINSEEQDAIFRVVAVILHLGNIEFTKGTEMDSSIPKDEKSWFHLKTAAELFMCDVKSLEDSLCKRVIVTRDETITKELDPEAAAISRDALAKVVYSRLFDWLVDRINSSIGQDPDLKYIIRVLDIYGFESFKTNSFEQFCINLTNEEIQQHFNQHVFKMEQEEYTKEEINWSYIEFIDNQDILDLIEKKRGGIIALLDEASMFPSSTHDTFAQKLYQTFKNHQRFTKPKLARSDLTICHYAGDVTHLSASECSFVSSLFPTSSDESAKSSKFSSFGTGFKKLLQLLLETLSSTEPHYIRCVKPNNLLKPAIFENHNVLQQLRCGGVLEAIRIICAGYPTRKLFDEFVERFGILAPDVLDGNSDEIRACKRLLEKAGLEGYQIGETKVFLRAGHMAELDARRTEILGKSASIIQRKVRSFIARKSFILLRRSVLQLQSICRGQLTRQVYESMRREASSIRIQRNLQENVDALIECVMKDIGFSQGKPVAAFTIYKCLLHWKSFEVESTSVFYCLIHMIGSAIEDQDNNEHMAYWLSNASTLLFLLQRSIKSDGANSVRKPPPPTSLFGRMIMGFRSSPSTVNAAAAALEVVQQVEAKYPALLFKQQLTAYVEKMCGIIRGNLKKELGSFLTLCIQGFHSSPSTVNLAADAAALEVVRQFEAKYPALLFKQQLTAYVEKMCGIIRDNLKKELGSFLTSCIQAPRATKGVLRSGRSFSKDSESNHWQGIIDCLNTFLSTLKENFVPPIIVQKIFTQIFSYINVQLFNSLLLRRECCTFSNGEYVKAGLAELELWCAQAKEEYAGSAWDELEHIRQAVGFLVIHKKCRISYDEIINDLCPILSVQQLYRICTLYWDDNYNTRSVSPDVISSMRVLMTEDSNNAASNSFLLDDNSSIPFSVDDLSSSLQVKDFRRETRSRTCGKSSLPIFTRVKAMETLDPLHLPFY